ncbi:MAG: GNAT family N-acetyltransferase [Bacteroidia bacterium]
MKEKEFLTQLTYEPLTKKTWSAFENLFGEKGACGGCWCMYDRIKKTDFAEGKYESNKQSFKEIVWSGKPTGLLAFYEDEAIAWCSLAPRENFMRIENSRVHKRIDDKPVWSMTCFFIKKEFRNCGLSTALIESTKKYAKQNKIKFLEAYPTIPYSKKMPDSFAWIGIYSAFKKAGFKIINHASKSRPMVRYEVK